MITKSWHCNDKKSTIKWNRTATATTKYMVVVFFCAMIVCLKKRENKNKLTKQKKKLREKPNKVTFIFCSLLFVTTTNTNHCLSSWMMMLLLCPFIYLDITLTPFSPHNNKCKQSLCAHGRFYMFFFLALSQINLLHYLTSNRILNWIVVVRFYVWLYSAHCGGFNYRHDHYYDYYYYYYHCEQCRIYNLSNCNNNSQTNTNIPYSLLEMFSFVIGMEVAVVFFVRILLLMQKFIYIH